MREEELKELLNLKREKNLSDDDFLMILNLTSRVPELLVREMNSQELYAVAEEMMLIIDDDMANSNEKKKSYNEILVLALIRCGLVEVNKDRKKSK